LSLELDLKVTAKFTFRLASKIANHPLPPKILVTQEPAEPLDHVLLKVLAYVLFYRDRLQIEPRLHDDNIPFIPDLVQLDFELRPALWIECGETPARKLDKLAVKVPQAEIWLMQRSPAALAAARGEMHRCGLRNDRYRLLALEAVMFDEALGLLRERNEIVLYRCDLAGGQVQFDFNGVWFEAEVTQECF
jgi:uncharacterized protein YaeQ